MRRFIICATDGDADFWSYQYIDLHAPNKTAFTFLFKSQWVVESK